jgi:hypothetical protein|tara:strand:+ start:3080 stop:3319 length:240 start_codon:yes stop_codon:yes gene_type:complete
LTPYIAALCVTRDECYPGTSWHDTDAISAKETYLETDGNDNSGDHVYGSLSRVELFLRDFCSAFSNTDIIASVIAFFAR